MGVENTNYTFWVVLFFTVLWFTLGALFVVLFLSGVVQGNASLLFILLAVVFFALMALFARSLGPLA